MHSNALKIISVGFLKLEFDRNGFWTCCLHCNEMKWNEKIALFRIGLSTRNVAVLVYVCFNIESIANGIDRWDASQTLAKWIKWFTWEYFIVVRETVIIALIIINVDSALVQWTCFSLDHTIDSNGILISGETICMLSHYDITACSPHLMSAKQQELFFVCVFVCEWGRERERVCVWKLKRAACSAHNTRPTMAHKSE